MRLLWNLWPQSALPCAIPAAALLLITGIIGRRRASAMIGGIVICLLMTSFSGMFMDYLPWWIPPLLLAGSIVSALRLALNRVIGKHAADHAIGTLVAGLIRGGFKLLFSPLRVLAYRIRQRS